MLAQTLVLIAMIAVVAASAVAGIAGYARAETAVEARALIAPALDAALARYESATLVPAIVAAADPGDASAPPAANAALNGAVVWPTQQMVIAPTAPSPLEAAISVVPTAASVPACDPAGAAVNAGVDLEQHGQCSAFVQESRLSLTLTADVGPAAGSTVAPLAHGVATVTLRLTSQPPYAMLVGRSDDPAPGDPHEGDVGGYGNALGTFGPLPAPDDTTVHVVYACTAAVGDCSASRPVPADAPTSLPWTNGNAGTGG